MARNIIIVLLLLCMHMKMIWSSEKIDENIDTNDTSEKNTEEVSFRSSIVSDEVDNFLSSHDHVTVEEKNENERNVGFDSSLELYEAEVYDQAKQNRKKRENTKNEVLLKTEYADADGAGQIKKNLKNMSDTKRSGIILTKRMTETKGEYLKTLLGALSFTKEYNKEITKNTDLSNCFAAAIESRDIDNKNPHVTIINNPKTNQIFCYYQGRASNPSISSYFNEAKLINLENNGYYEYGTIEFDTNTPMADIDLQSALKANIIKRGQKITNDEKFKLSIGEDVEIDVAPNTKFEINEIFSSKGQEMIAVNPPSDFQTSGVPVYHDGRMWIDPNKLGDSKFKVYHSFEFVRSKPFHPGVYITEAEEIISSEFSIGSSKVAKVPRGIRLNIIKIVTDIDKRIIRGQLANYGWWVDMKNLNTGRMSMVAESTETTDLKKFFKVWEGEYSDDFFKNLWTQKFEETKEFNLARILERKGIERFSQTSERTSDGNYKACQTSIKEIDNDNGELQAMIEKYPPTKAMIKKNSKIEKCKEIGRYLFLKIVHIRMCTAEVKKACEHNAEFGEEEYAIEYLQTMKDALINDNGKEPLYENFRENFGMRSCDIKNLDTHEILAIILEFEKEWKKKLYSDIDNFNPPDRKINKLKIRKLGKVKWFGYDERSWKPVDELRGEVPGATLERIISMKRLYHNNASVLVYKLEWQDTTGKQFYTRELFENNTTLTRKQWKKFDHLIQEYSRIYEKKL